MVNFLSQWFFSADLLSLTLFSLIGGTLLFAAIYFLFAGSAYVATKIIMPAARFGGVIDARPLKPQQIRSEISYSLISIFIFGLYTALTVVLLRLGVVSVDWGFRGASFAVDVVLLFLWNELHFYFCHRLMHVKFFFSRVHRVHHQSIVPTPFSTYSLHWFEALLLGSVMVTVMPLHTFSVYALLLLPLISLAGNTIGHSNYELFPERSRRGGYSAGREHGLHHSKAGGNFGFLLPYFDRLFRTEVAKSKREVKL